MTHGWEPFHSLQNLAIACFHFCGAATKPSRSITLVIGQCRSIARANTQTTALTEGLLILAGLLGSFVVRCFT